MSAIEKQVNRILEEERLENEKLAGHNTESSKRIEAKLAKINHMFFTHLKDHAGAKDSFIHDGVVFKVNNLVCYLELSHSEHENIKHGVALREYSLVVLGDANEEIPQSYALKDTMFAKCVFLIFSEEELLNYSIDGDLGTKKDLIQELYSRIVSSIIEYLNQELQNYDEVKGGDFDLIFGEVNDMEYKIRFPTYKK